MISMKYAGRLFGLVATLIVVLAVVFFVTIATAATPDESHVLFTTSMEDASYILVNQDDGLNVIHMMDDTDHQTVCERASAADYNLHIVTNLASTDTRCSN